MAEKVNNILEKTRKKPDYQLLRGRVTLSHVAKEAGVAVSTASAILGEKDHCYASDKTCQMVKSVAKRLGYTPNRFARGLREQRTKLIGVTCSEITRPASSLSKISSIEDKVLKDGLKVIFGTHRYDYKREKEYLNEFLAYQVDGLIVFDSNQENSELLSNIAKTGMPMVACEFSPGLCDNLSSVTTNRELAGYLQVKHVLQDAKRKKILFLMGCTSGLGADKVRGYKKALKEFGSDINEHLVVERKEVIEQNVFQVGSEMASEVLDKNLDFDAVITTSDILALGAMKIIQKVGKKVPEDVAVIGFDDEGFSAVLPVPLTTIKHPQNLAKVAYDLLKKQIECKEKNIQLDYQKILLDPELIVRESTIKMQNVYSDYSLVNEY